jgi:hypothetical protein
MKRIFIIAWALTLAALYPMSAKAGTEALISFHGTDNGSWERRFAIKELLSGHYGFDEVNILTDATAEEVPNLVRKFLEAPRRNGDKRFVWVSGLQGAQGKTVCPSLNYAPVQPAAPSLILAPNCYLGSIRFPQGARHYSLTTPKLHRVSARLGRIDASDPAWVALLTLPVGNNRFITRADTLVFNKLTAGKEKGVMDPNQILQTLRSDFRWNGSSYTPTLDLFHRGTELDQLGPFGFLQGDTAQPRLDRIKPTKRRIRKLSLYPTSFGHRGSAIVVPGTEPVRVLRSDRTGGMRYVTIGDNLFGWVPSHDLQL